MCPIAFARSVSCWMGIFCNHFYGLEFDIAAFHSLFICGSIHFRLAYPKAYTSRCFWLRVCNKVIMVQTSNIDRRKKLRNEVNNLSTYILIKKPKILDILTSKCSVWCKIDSWCTKEFVVLKLPLHAIKIIFALVILSINFILDASNIVLHISTYS